MNSVPFRSKADGSQKTICSDAMIINQYLKGKRNVFTHKNLKHTQISKNFFGTIKKNEGATFEKIMNRSQERQYQNRSSSKMIRDAFPTGFTHWWNTSISH